METPRVPPQEFAESMKQDMEQYLKEVMAAVNNAADGEWIAGSEETGAQSLGRDAPPRILKRRYRSGLMRRKPAFPPSAPSDDGQAAGELKAGSHTSSYRQRRRQDRATLVVWATNRQHRPGG